MEKLKIIIADDHKIFRDGLKLALETTDFIEIIDEAETGYELLEKLKINMPDLIFMDISMPQTNGIQTTFEVLKINPLIKIIMLTSFADIETVNQAIYAGASGYLLKNTDYKEIIEAVMKIAQGNTYLSDEILNLMISEKKESIEKQNLPQFYSKIVLTKREKQVLAEICEGNSTKSISSKLFISRRTVQKHIQNIMAKTDTHSVAKLIIFSMKNNIIQ